MFLSLNPEEPIKLGARGRQAIEQAVRLMLFTPKGAVPMRPEFGNALLNRLDEPVNLAQAAQDIADALSQDPRIEVRRVEIDSTALAQGQVAIKLALNFLGAPSELDDVALDVDELIYLISPIVPLPDAEIDMEGDGRLTVEFRFLSPCFRELVLEVASDAKMQNITHASTGETRIRTVFLPRRHTYWWRVRTTDSSVMTVPRKFRMPIDFTFSYLGGPPFVISVGSTINLNFYLDLTRFDVDSDVLVELLNDSDLLYRDITVEPKKQLVRESGEIWFEVTAGPEAIAVVAVFRASGLGIEYEIEVTIQVVR